MVIVGAAAAAGVGGGGDVVLLQRGGRGARKLHFAARKEPTAKPTSLGTPLWEGSWDAVRNLCVSLLQVLLQGDTLCPSQGRTTLGGVLGRRPKPVCFFTTGFTTR